MQHANFDQNLILWQRIHKSTSPVVWNGSSPQQYLHVGKHFLHPEQQSILPVQKFLQHFLHPEQQSSQQFVHPVQKIYNIFYIPNNNLHNNLYILCKNFYNNFCIYYNNLHYL